jgi:hypothetical protein
LIYADQPFLLVKSIGTGILAFIALAAALGATAAWAQAAGGSLFGIAAVLPTIFILLSIGAGYLYYHNKRETIFVSDLISGRYFKCPSIVALIHKEAWLEGTCAYFRQLMECANNWDGTEKKPVPALPPDLAKEAILTWFLARKCLWW